MKTKKTPAKKKPAKQTPKQIAVAIAEDVIKQINGEKMVARQGVYLGLSEEKPWSVPEFLRASKDGEELQDILKKTDTSQCQVCALGSAFLSAVRLKDDFKIKWHHYNGIDSQEMRERLSSYFTDLELRDIEAVFEGDTDTNWDGDHAYPELHLAYKELSASKLLIFIMKQIIAQKGKFDLDKAEKAASKI